MATPTLKRSWGFVGCTSNQFDVGNNFKIRLEPSGSPCAVAVGDFVIVTARFPSGRTLTVSDDQTNTWTVGVSANDGTSKYAIVWTSIASGKLTSVITLGFDANTADVQTSCHIFYNCDTSATPTDGSSSTTGIVPTNNTNPNVSAGSLTTAVNGDLIFNVAFDSSSPVGVANATPAITFGSGWSGLHGEVVFGSATQYQVQNTAGAINPGMLWSQTGTHDTFASLALAIKAGTGGAAPGSGIYILKSQMEFFQSVAETLTVPFPTTGNLMVVCNEAGTEGSSLSNVTDSSGSNTWALVSVPATYPQLWWASNVAASNAMTLSLTTNTATGNDLIGMFDIVGAASSPLDTGATAANSSVLTGSNSGVTRNTGSQGSAGAQISDAASIKPFTSNGLIIAATVIGTGPATGTLGTTGETYDYVSATWSTSGSSTGDSNAFGNGDGMAHYFNPNTTAVNFAWNMSNTVASSWQAIAAAFKAAPIGAGIPFEDDSFNPSTNYPLIQQSEPIISIF